MAESRFWVGSNGKGILVFDRHVQIVGIPHIFLWDLNSCEMESYIAEVARQQVTSIKEDKAISSAIDAYLVWYKQHGNKWLSEENQYQETRKMKESDENNQRLELVEKHAQYLSSRGLTNDGTRIASNGRLHRTPPCWRCKKHLDNSFDIECALCGWIICNCGACGCKKPRGHMTKLD